MDSRLLMFIVFACAMTGIQGLTVTSLSSNITRSGCGNSTGGKLCFTDCSPSNTSCVFGSSQSGSNSTLNFELSGPGGFVALGLTTNQSQGIPYVFLCINSTSINCSDSANNCNSTNVSLIFLSGSTNTSNILTLSNTTSVTTVQGNVSSSGYIQCTFSAPSNLSTSRASNTGYFVSLFNGGSITNSFNMTSSSVFTSTKALDLTDPTSNVANTTNSTTAAPSTTNTTKNGSVGPLAQALVILLSAMGLLALY